jgi:radical SAM protein with 4Fe4S-binding SPASM domain
MGTWKKLPEYRQKIKRMVIDHYGKVCSCCGESELVFLVIDHIQGGGNKHRKITGDGSNFYHWVVKNDYPLGFQVLCHNCNFAKSCGECPHKKLRV